MTRSAKAMLPVLRKKLAKHRQHVRPILILTGHSAGGGVASLLFELLVRDPKLDSFRNGDFSLHYTFRVLLIIMSLSGYSHIHCVTFASAAVMSTAGTTANNPKNIHVSFVNLDDPVPRLDYAYANWLARALAEVYNRETADHVSGDKESLCDPSTIIGPLPPQELRPGGQLVLLADRVAREISHSYLEQCLFLDAAKHNKFKYQERLENLGVLR
jgi:hypothetical protein